jgi:hypothetical protein
MSTSTKRKIRQIKIRTLDSELNQAKASYQKTIVQCLKSQKIQANIKNLSCQSDFTNSSNTIQFVNNIKQSLNNRLTAIDSDFDSKDNSKIEQYIANGITSLIKENLLVSPKQIKGELQILSNSSEITQAKVAIHTLKDKMINEHQLNLERLICQSVEQSAIEQGFTNIETVRERNVTKVIATDQIGHALISEIKDDSDGCVINSEVAGYFDGSCHKILNDFEKALVAKGIQGDIIECHKTYGIPLLETTKSFLNRSYQSQRLTKSDKNAQKNKSSNSKSKHLYNKGRIG